MLRSNSPGIAMLRQPLGDPFFLAADRGATRPALT